MGSFGNSLFHASLNAGCPSPMTKEIMRSGPATRTAWSTKCLAACLTAALSSRGALSDFTALGRGRVPAHHCGSPDPQSPIFCQQFSPTFAGGNSEEAATPGQASTRHHVSGNPPAVHPREPLETTGIFTMLRQALQADRAACRHCARSRFPAQA